MGVDIAGYGQKFGGDLDGRFQRFDVTGILGNANASLGHFGKVLLDTARRRVGAMEQIDGKRHNHHNHNRERDGPDRIDGLRDWGLEK